jgi:hypothetical protein
MDASRADVKSNYARAMVLLATGVLSAIAIWLFSPQLTGQVGPGTLMRLSGLSRGS